MRCLTHNSDSKGLEKIEVRVGVEVEVQSMAFLKWMMVEFVVLVVVKRDKVGLKWMTTQRHDDDSEKFLIRGGGLMVVTHPWWLAGCGLKTMMVEVGSVKGHEGSKREKQGREGTLKGERRKGSEN
ncbi:hypothetical protein RJT34_02009 [Clitoria ternatea]|uniref:Uncharacterized protein n=1 Tax=Clitoria ternatea TaxID=43366 RepID=A0AAN9KJX5_CLITE